jgi:uncharacterized protein YecT (DUF1311 family)
VIKTSLATIVSMMTLCCYVVTCAASDKSHAQFELAKHIAELNEITTNTGQNFAYLEESKTSGLVLVYETISSRTNYKIISPITRVTSDSIFMDCSYIKAYDDIDKTVSVGGFCRGETKITRDLLGESMSRKNLFTYSSTLPWLEKIKKVVNCKTPIGLVYSGIYFVRCQIGDNDETTENITITAFSPDLRKIITIVGHEFIPAHDLKNIKPFTFFRLKRNSTYEIVEKNISFGTQNTTEAATKNDHPCVNAMTNNELNACSSLAYERADKKLNVTYKKLAAQLTPEQLEKFKSVQRLWVSFKEKECQDTYDSTYPGAEALLEKNACLEMLTDDRVVELQRINGPKKDKFDRIMAALIREGYSKEKLVAKFNALYLYNTKWSAYTKAWCEYLVLFNGEDHDYCSSRLNFMRAW